MLFSANISEKEIISSGEKQFQNFRSAFNTSYMEASFNEIIVRTFLPFIRLHFHFKENLNIVEISGLCSCFYLAFFQN